MGRVRGGSTVDGYEYGLRRRKQTDLATVPSLRGSRLAEFTGPLKQVYVSIRVTDDKSTECRTTIAFALLACCLGCEGGQRQGGECEGSYRGRGDVDESASVKCKGRRIV